MARRLYAGSGRRSSRKQDEQDGFAVLLMGFLLFNGYNWVVAKPLMSPSATLIMSAGVCFWMMNATQRRYPRVSLVALVGSLTLLAVLCINVLTVGFSLPRGPFLLLGLLFATVGCALILRMHTRWKNQQRERYLQAAIVDLSPTEFEKRIGFLLEDLGWQSVRWVGGANDGGVDILGTYHGQRYVVQCKHWPDRCVDVGVVRQMESVRQHQKADRAVVVTTGRFGPASYDWAKTYPVDLWNGDILGRKLREAEERQRDPAVLARARRRRMYALSALAVLSGCLILWFTFGGR